MRQRTGACIIQQLYYPLYALSSPHLQGIAGEILCGHRIMLYTARAGGEQS